MTTDDPSPAGMEPLPSARSYQLEMYEESLKRNIIVAMDTGSGKTLIAVERIRTELIHRSPSKIVWFLSPNVALTYQQAKVIRRGLGDAYIVKALTGNDKVDTWKSQKVWTDALLNVNVVVCTYQVLLDALIHGFVSLAGVSLLVFDEAHHCNGKAAANGIMQRFYHVQKLEHGTASSSTDLPVILGLSASPVTRQGAKGLHAIEQNLDAISKTPRVHRAELLKYVNRPVLSAVTYSAIESPSSDALNHLRACYTKMNIDDDPYVVHLRKTCSVLLESTITKRNTYSQKNIGGLTRAAAILETELGPWASQYYVATCTSRFLESYKELAWLEGDDSDKTYMHATLSDTTWEVPSPSALTGSHALSSKLTELVRIITTEFSTGTTSGIVFVETRAQVHVLSVILDNLPKTKELVRSVTFVGASNSYLKKGQMRELLDARHNDTAVEELRSGRKNLIICTSVCEEGIDISACNLVVCFQPPPNLRSFVQRRGRARATTSKYIVMLPGDGTKDKALAQWLELEKEMEAEYMCETRKLEELKKLESEDDGYRELFIESTGAKLTLQSSVQHLNHFCQKLPSASYTTLKPIFLYEQYVNGEDITFDCRVELPNALDGSLRRFQSVEKWPSEKMARADAAFEAYRALRDAALVNDNLLPEPVFDKEAQAAYTAIEKRPSMVKVDNQLDPWFDLASRWSMASPQIWTTVMTMQPSSGHMHDMTLLSPCELPRLPKLKLYIDARSEVVVSFGTSQLQGHTDGLVATANDATRILLQSVFGARMTETKSGFPVCLLPTSISDLPDWTSSVTGSSPAIDLLDQTLQSQDVGLIRTKDNRRFTFHGIEMHAPIAPDSQFDEAELPSLHLKCRPLPKRSNFLHPVSGPAATHTAFEYLDPSLCTVDRLPVPYVEFARMIPSILHHIERYMVAEDLRTSLLAPVAFSSAEALLPGLTASSAHEGFDYQRLEFLGDAILKMMTAVNLMAQHPLWHEGYLSGMKDHIVGNGRLALAAEKSGLLKYLITKQFTTNKWKPTYNDELLQSNDSQGKSRELSTKTIADVIEAIIGAAFLDGGLHKVLLMLQLFLPEVKWQPLSELNNLLTARASSITIPQNPMLGRLEGLLNYIFSNKALLLEAITHPSLTTSQVPSYQRLEFLGDAILDFIVTQIIFNHAEQPPVYRMHRLRTATVNAGFLSYRALSASAEVNTMQATLGTNEQNGHQQPLVKSTQKLSLLSFLLKAPLRELAAALSKTRSRFDLLQPMLKDSLESDKEYPWRLLAALNPEKTVSDIVEAVLGAVWIDSKGDFGVVEQVARTLGLLTWLDKALEKGLKCWHPKEEIGKFGAQGAQSGVQYIVWCSRDKVSLQPDEGEQVQAEDSNGVIELEANDENDGAEGLELGKGTWHCRLNVNGELVCITHGWNRLEVEVAAAEEAVRILGTRRPPQYEEHQSAEKAENDVEVADNEKAERFALHEDDDIEMGDIQEAIADHEPKKEKEVSRE